MEIKRIIQDKILSKSFNRNVIKVFSGSTLATIIPFITLPILTRIYSAADFGNFQLLLSIVTLFISIGSLQFQLAIVLPNNKKESDKLFILSVFVLLFVTILVSFILWVGSDIILPLFNAINLQPYIYLISLGIFLGGLLQAVRYLLVKDELYSDLAKSHVSHQLFTQGSSLSVGLVYPSFISLFISHIAGFLIATLIAIKKHKLTNEKEISYKHLAKKYKKFPLINSPMVFLNDFSLQLPVFMISAYFSPEIIGLYMLSQRIAYKPMAIISSSFSQVYYKEASEAYLNSPHVLLEVYKSTIKKLIFIGVILIAGLNLLLAPSINILFGEEWGEAALYVHILSFWFFFQFLNSPISKTLSIINKQELGLIIISISIVIRFLVMYLFNDSIVLMLVGLSISAGLFYFIYNLNIYQLLKRMSS